MDVLESMLTGSGDLNVPVYVVRNYMMPHYCERIKNEFFNIIDQTAGGNRIEDFVMVYQIGATQFQKTASEYFEECAVSKPNVEKLLSGIDDPKVVAGFMLEADFKKYFSRKNIRFGPSTYEGEKVNLFTARLWNNPVELSLQAHDDLAQLSVAQRDNYDIGKVEIVIASNLCVYNQCNSKLLLWNIAPDEQTKKQLDLDCTGYPYPQSCLEGIDYLTVKTNPGDLYFINANHVHAVSKEKRNERITLGRFIGQVSPDRVEYWT